MALVVRLHVVKRALLTVEKIVQMVVLAIVKAIVQILVLLVA